MARATELQEKLGAFLLEVESCLTDIETSLVHVSHPASRVAAAVCCDGWRTPPTTSGRRNYEGFPRSSGLCASDGKLEAPVVCRCTEVHWES